MRIGIDATTVTRHRTGVGNYIVQLVRGLAGQPGDHEFTVFTTAEEVGEFDGLTQVRAIPVALPTRGARLAWEQMYLPRLVRRERLDLLHSPHYTTPMRLRARSVVTFHDMTFVTHPQWHVASKRLLFPLIMRWSARRATHLIADSHSTRADLIRVLGVPPDRVTAVPLGAGTEYAPAAPEVVAAVCRRHGLDAGRYVLYIGVLEPRKNIPKLIGAFARIAATLPDVLLAIGQEGMDVRSDLRSGPAVRSCRAGPLSRVRAAYGSAGAVHRGPRLRVSFPSRGVRPSRSGGHALRRGGGDEQRLVTPGSRG